MKPNKTTMKITGICVLLASFTSISAMADRHDRRQVRQGARIHQGMKGGELTQGEAGKMKRTQARIRRKERKFEADGVVTPQEKAKLEKMQDRANKQIHKLKHNDNKPGENSPVEAPQADAPPADASGPSN
jgi:hypothetical protein